MLRTRIMSLSQRSRSQSAKVRFGHIRFCMGKGDNYLFFWKLLQTWSQSCLKHSATELMKLSEYQRSRSFFDLGHRLLRIQS